LAYWSVAQTENQRETTAALWLGRFGYETYLPRIKTVYHVRDRSQRTRTISRIEPLFRSYLFVRIIDRWSPIKSCIGILDVLLAGDQPACVSEKEINRIKAKERGGLIRLPEPKVLKLGDRIRVVNRNDLWGGLGGIYQGMSGKDRVRVLLELLGHDVKATLPKNEIVAEVA
jgi:transcription antitermination factor NusG